MCFVLNYIGDDVEVYDFPKWLDLSQKIFLQCVSTGMPITVCFIDLLNTGLLKECCGFDAMLDYFSSFKKAIIGTLKKGDYGFHLEGGDEFVIILTRKKEEDFEDKIRGLFEKILSGSINKDVPFLTGCGAIGTAAADNVSGYPEFDDKDRGIEKLEIEAWKMCVLDKRIIHLNDIK